jgi:hypothetical protein
LYTAPAAVGLLVGVSGAEPVDKPLRDMTPEERQVVFEQQLADAYLATFGPAMERFERLPRLVGTVAVARLDSPEATAALVDSLQFSSGLVDNRRARRGGVDPVAAWLAWEALRGRLDSMDEAQLQTWRQAGLASARSGGFPGELAAEVFAAASAMPSASFDDKLVGEAVAAVVGRASWDEDSPAAELVAARHAVALWQDMDVVRALLERDVLREEDAPQKVSYVLSSLPDAPPAEEGKVDDRAVMKRWRPWVNRTDLTPAKAQDLPSYTATNLLLPTPEEVDLEDESWRDAFESGDLEVQGVDLAWVIDSTGSMAEENKAVARATGRVMGLLSVLSNEARGSAVYVRHETFDRLKKNCCRDAEQHPLGYTAKPYPLTTDSAALSQAMFDEPVPTPNKDKWANMHPGTAVHGGLYAAQEALQWNRERRALHAIVVVGDAKIEGDTPEPAAQLAYDMSRRGFRIFALHTNKPDDDWRRAIEEAAGGTVVQFKAGDIDRSGLPKEPLKEWGVDAAAEQFGKINPFEDIALKIADTAVTEAYRPRVRQVMVAVGPYMRAAYPDLQPGKKGNRKNNSIVARQ